MSQQKIADFFAEIGIKVSERSLKALTNNLEKIVTKLEKAESAGRAMSGILKGTSKAADLENKSIQAGNKVLAERQKRYEAVNKIAAKIRKNNERVGRITSKTSMFASEAFDAYRRSGPARWVKANSGRMVSSQWNKRFKESVGGLTSNSKGISSRAYNAQQDMYNKLFGAVDTSAAEKERALIDRLHGQAIREDNRRTRAAQNLARIQENVAKREQLMAERTAAIREAGAKRAAAIMHAAELRAQSMASRSSGSHFGGSGRGFGVAGGATVGGAIGSASSSAAGFLPGFGGAYALVNLNRMGQELQSVENALLAVSSSEQEAAERLKFLESVGAEMGKTVRGLGPEFVKLTASIQGTALAGQEQGIFKSFMKYGTVMGLDEESMKGTFRAVSQMVSKQQVYAEELRGQLAERMPAAVRIAAEVMTGGDTKALNKMMEEGKLDPNELLPKMAAYMDKLANTNQAYAKALKTSIVAQGRMNFQWEQFVKLFAKAGGDDAFSRIFNAIANFFKSNPALAKGMADGLSKVATGIEWLLEGLTNLIEAFTKVANSMGLTGTELALITTGLLMVMTPFGRVLAIAYALYLVLEDLYVSLNGGDGVFKRFYDSLSSENQQKLIDLGESLGKLTDAFKELFAAFSELEIQPLKPMFESAFGGIAELIQGHIDRLTTLVRLMARITSGDWSGAADIAAASVQQRLVGMGQTVLSVLPSDIMGGDMSTGVYSSGMNRQDYLFNKGYQGYTKATDSPITFGNVNVTLNVENADPSVMGYDAANLVAEAFKTQLKVASKDFNTGKTQ